MIASVHSGDGFYFGAVDEIERAWLVRLGIRDLQARGSGSSSVEK